MNLGIGGKVALVVGASAGMGRAAALELAAAGCRLIVAGMDRQRLTALRDELDAPCLAFVGDLMEPRAVDEMVASAIQAAGAAPDIIVHALGGSMGIKDHLLPSSDWAKVWRLNIGIPHDINRVFLQAMRSRGWGRIVHFSSNAVKLGIGHSPYAAAKASVESYVATMAREYSRHGVIISGVRPGPINTGASFIYQQSEEWTSDFFDKFVPMRRWGRPEEAAKVVAFLCSEHSSYMAGAIVDVDGGMR